MANRSGTIILNEVLKEMNNMGLLDEIGEEKTKELIKKLIKIGNDFDCENGDIVKDLEAIAKVCYCCNNIVDELNEYGCCEKCAD